MTRGVAGGAPAELDKPELEKVGKPLTRQANSPPEPLIADQPARPCRWCMSCPICIWPACAEQADDAAPHFPPEGGYPRVFAPRASRHPCLRAFAAIGEFGR